jgi:hypothetical protein
LRPWRLLAAVIVIALLVTSVAGGLLLWHELNTSRLQAREIARYAARLDYQRVAGPSDAIRFPAHGPFDQRSATPSCRALPNACRRAASRSPSRCASTTR